MSVKTHKYITIKKQIKDRIASGRLVEKLPGERVLAEELNASYMTIRKAIAGLVEEGILIKSGTRGTFVNHKKNNSKPTLNIGFFLDEEIKEGISSPYYSLIFKSLEEEVTRNGYNMLFFSDFDDLNPLKNPKKVDAVVISCFPRIEEKIQQIKNYLPMVIFDNIAADKSIPSVTIDNFNSCSHSVEYLIELGHTRIGFVSGLMDSDVCRDRLLGYKNALLRVGINEDKTLNFRGDYSFESGERAGKYFAKLTNHPSAIVCANDMMAIGLMKVLQENRIKIPEEISVIGFDDILLASKVFPTLTTNAAPIAEMARQAVEILLAAMRGEQTDYRHVILEAKLIKRDSCRAIPS
jgi:DNA-binding LacI/PurR family transcriptional regulator